jgi:hypothetical protein
VANSIRRALFAAAILLPVGGCEGGSTPPGPTTTPTTTTPTTTTTTTTTEPTDRTDPVPPPSGTCWEGRWQVRSGSFSVPLTLSGVDSDVMLRYISDVETLSLSADGTGSAYDHEERFGGTHDSGSTVMVAFNGDARFTVQVDDGSIRFSGVDSSGTIITYLDDSAPADNVIHPGHPACPTPPDLCPLRALERGPIAAG